MRSTFVSLLSLAVLPLVAAHSNRNSRHTDAAKRGSKSLSKRSFSGQFTYFDDGMGACGHESKPSDFIVALNSAQYDGGKYCGETITITYNGKSTEAVIMDECPGCGMGGLDMSTGLFQYFAAESVGVLEGTWSFGSSGSGGDKSSSSSPKPSSTTQHTTSTKATTTWTPTSTSTTHSSTHTTSSSTHTTSSTHSTTTSSSSSSKASTTSHSSSSTSATSSAAATTSANYNTGADAGLAQATGTLSAGVSSNLGGLNQAFIGLAGLLVSAANDA